MTITPEDFDAEMEIITKAKEFISEIEAWNLPQNYNRGEVIVEFRKMADTSNRFADWIETLTDGQFSLLRGSIH